MNTGSDADRDQKGQSFDSIAEVMMLPINELSSNPSDIKRRQQTKLPNTEYQSVLESENDRLRKEVFELRRKMNHIQETQRRKQHESKTLLISKTSPKKEKQKQKNVLLELPLTMLDRFGDFQNSTNKTQKSHLSDSTTDEKETIEPNMDIEAHQSASGLYHRSTNTNTTAGTINTNNTEASSSFKTRRTDNLSDCSSSSSDGDGDGDDDPMAEARVLIGGDSRCHNRERNGISLDKTDIVALALNDSQQQQQQEQQQLTFCQSLTDRAGWLIGLLIFQSLSSFILARNESLLQHHAVIVQFLTMLVGAGGNAGNQASVGVIRGIAVGTINSSNVRNVLKREFAMGVSLSLILGLAGFVRAKVFLVPWMETFSITASLFMIVIISVVVGATLPLCMNRVGIDPAHSSTTIQVIMDITGVVITVQVSSLMLDSDFHDWLEIALSLDGETR